MTRPLANALLGCALLSLGSCQKDDTPPATSDEEQRHPASQTLAARFPLLPIIEKSLWQQLQDAESVAADPEATQQHSKAEAEIDRITGLLQEKHPFEQDENRTTLGGIVYDKESGAIEIPVQAYYPRKDDDRHPGELEVILCSKTGRSHETLFTTDTRPMHLELLLHLAGYQKNPPASTFKIEIVIPDHEPIPIETFIESTDRESMPKHLHWEFSGGEFNDPYLPDMTGDFIICWHAHDSVLRIRNQKIASGELKLKVVPHPALKQNQPATLVLSPE